MPDDEITKLDDDIVMLYKGMDIPVLSKAEIAVKLPGVSDEEIEESLSKLTKANILEGGENMGQTFYSLAKEIVFE